MKRRSIVRTRTKGRFAGKKYPIFPSRVGVAVRRLPKVKGKRTRDRWITVAGRFPTRSERREGIVYILHQRNLRTAELRTLEEYSSGKREYSYP